MTLGFRIKRNWERVSAGLTEQFKPLPVANVSDSMGRMDAGGPALRPYHRDGVMAGPAFTVRTRPGDNLLLHKALDAAAPGDIIVCDSGGDPTNSMIGEMMVTHAMVRGVAGFVINGSVRDRDELLEINLPIYALGATHRGPYKDGPGEIGFPISLSGMVINPGDLILGDGDGVLCVPREHAQSVLEAAKAKQKAEVAQLKQIKEGTVDRSWVDEALAAKGCEYVD
ncbi:RraA family protein [Thalassospiraceae bacterium LMO-JJ14]|nr:RraA family protein [Thalassospiraceae bacterium LMO-JJ14]